ncbi:MAG: PIN domain-containing protein [Betaproteobacteria bacterium]|nr:PIN domain-containing protein [Betaproteobacteria bacterium]
MRAALVDTGPLVALFVRGDPDHRRVKSFFKKYQGPLVTTWPVVTEVCHFLDPAVALRFLRWIEGGGAAVIELPPDEAGAIADLMQRYLDRPMDLADASLVWLAAHTGIADVLTLDEGDFQTYRTPSGQPFADLLGVR